MSQTERIKIDLERLEQDLNSASLSELSKNETNIRCEVKHRISDLENFKLNVVKMKDLSLENSLSQSTENLERVVPSAPLNDEFD